MTRPSLALAAALLAVLVLAAPAAGQATWTLGDHPPPPAGAEFRVPLGAPGDLQFIRPNRGLLAVQGNATVPRGLLVWNGESWRQLATVCGGPASTTRIAWASEREFWTITSPSRPRQGDGLALCRFRDGQVVGSFSTAPQVRDPYRQLFAAACTGPDDCWFAGEGSADPSGEREGTFHLHWDGRALSSSYAPQGRAASDLEAHAGALVESVVVGRRPVGRAPDVRPPDLATPEDRPRLLRRIVGEAFVGDPFSAGPVPDATPDDERPAPVDATDLLALDSDGPDLWAVGGGTLSGAAAPDDPATPEREDQLPYPRGPVAVRPAGGTFAEVPLPGGAFGPLDRFVDVAAVPGDDTAWTAVQPFRDLGSSNARARVVRLAPDGRLLEDTVLPVSGGGRGSAARIASLGPADTWMVTSAGWVFHLTDGSRPPRDDDPAFRGPIDFRPNEAAAQFVPDTLPADDNRLFEPPPVEIEQAPAPATATTRRLPALLTSVRSRLRGRRALVISFRLRRAARIGIVGRRGSRVVARARTRTYRPGRRSIRVPLDPRRYPKRIAFSIRELGQPATPPAGGGDAPAETGGGGITITP